MHAPWNRLFSEARSSQPRRVRARLGALAALLAVGAADAQVQLPSPTIAAADAGGNSVYAVTLNAAGVINGTESLSSGGAPKLTLVDALVWVPDHLSPTSALDLVAADATHGRISLYASPNYGAPTTIFAYNGSGPAHPTGLAADSAGNIFITSLPAKPGSPSLWVLPFDVSTGRYDLAPILIDQSFGGVTTLSLAEVLVAATGATTPAGASSPAAWDAGDVLVLVGDTLNARVMVYSRSLIYRSSGALASSSFPLHQSIPTAVSMAQFGQKAAIPFGMDIWPADTTHGVSLLFTTLDGRIIRFDSSAGAFAADFAQGQGIGLQKLRVASSSATHYAFVAVPVAAGGGRILQFAAPPASGPNKPVGVLSSGVGSPIGLAASNSLVPVSACENQACTLGAGITLDITCPPGGCTFPPGATIQEEVCLVPADPRVTVTPNGDGGYNWSCGADSQGNTTLNVANYCPTYPATVLPPTICGHSGPTGSGFVVQKGTAEVVDLYAYNAETRYYWITDVNQYEPSSLYNLSCQPGPNGPLHAGAPRSDLYSIEGTIVEGGPPSGGNYFFEDTGACEPPGAAGKSGSMGLFGIALNVPAANMPAYVNTKFNNLSLTLSNAQAQITNPTVYSTLQSNIATAQASFNSANYGCALNQLAAIDTYLQVPANQAAFTALPPPGNPALYSETWWRTNGLYYTIVSNFTALGANTTVPPNNVPACSAIALNQPSGLAFNPLTGYLYVANYGTGQVLVYAPTGPNGQMVQQQALTLGGFINPVRLAFVPVSDGNLAGDLLVADVGATPGSNTVTVFSNNFGPDGNFVSNTVFGQINGLTRPLGVSADTPGYIYVAENYGGSAANDYTDAVEDIRVYNWDGAFILVNTFTQDSNGVAFSTIGALAYNSNAADLLVGLPNQVNYYPVASLTTNNALLCNGAATPCPPPPDPLQAPDVNIPGVVPYLNGVIGLAVDNSGNTDVTNYYSGQNGNSPGFIQFATYPAENAGLPTGLTLTGGPALANPQGVAVDSAGNIYVANNGNNTVDVYNSAGAYSYSIH